MYQEGTTIKVIGQASAKAHDDITSKLAHISLEGKVPKEQQGRQ